MPLYAGNELEPSTLHRIIEVLQSSYERGYLDIAGHLDFLATLVVRFSVYPGNVFRLFFFFLSFFFGSL